MSPRSKQLKMTSFCILKARSKTANKLAKKTGEFMEVSQRNIIFCQSKPLAYEGFTFYLLMLFAISCAHSSSSIM